MARSPSFPFRVTRAVVVALGAWMTASPVLAAPPMHFTSDFRWFDAENVGQDLARADFDGDGIDDLALTQPRVNAVSIYLGDHVRGFHSRVVYDAGPDPHEIGACDVDGDGHPDLVIANRTPGTLSILRGRGDGKFDPPRAYVVGDSAGAAVSGDFDGDGRLDLAVVSGAGHEVLSVLRGRGDGAFDPPREISRGAGPLRFVSVARKGRPADRLAVVDADGRVRILEAVQGGRFRPTDEFELAAPPTAVVAADVDNDGEPDLVVSIAAGAEEAGEGERGALRLLAGAANGRFRSLAGPDADFVASSLAAVDLDGDGWSDLVAVDRRGGTVSVFRNDRTGALLTPAKRPSRVGPGTCLATDWNCDGRPDLVAVSPRGRGVILLDGRGDGTFGDAIDVDTDFGPAGIWLGDVDGDGDADVVAVDRFTARLAVLRGDGTGRFEDQAAGATYRTRFAPRRVLGGRLVPGGPVDLVVAHGAHDGFLSFGRNAGDGTFTFSPEDTVQTGGLPFTFVLGDVDADGVTDAIVANDETRTVAVLLGDGSGRMRLHATLDAGPASMVDLALGDLDGDGHLDLVAASELSHRFVCWRGTGTGDFAAGHEYLAGLRPRSIALADLDGDGHLDLVSGESDAFPEGGLVAVYLGDGAGGFGPFAPGRTADVGYAPVDLVVADLDHEAPLDVAVANSGSSTITVLAGNPDRRYSFRESLWVGTGAAADAVVAGDVNRDGRTDLVFAGLTADRVGVLLNRTGDPSIPAPGLALDIAPGTCPNVLPSAAGAQLRVALVSGGGFDFADLLPSTVRLEGVPALGRAFELADETGPANACGDPCARDGRRPDGVPDAVFTFDAAAVAARLDPAGAEAQPLHLTARLRGGRVVTAVDCVVRPSPGAGLRVAGSGRLPASVGLTGANPLAPGGSVGFAYEVPAGGADVHVGVYTVAGRRVTSLARGFQGPGAHAATWSGQDEAGRDVPPGVYFLRARIGPVRTVARIVVVP